MITVIKPQYIKQYPTKYVLGLLNSSLFYVWLKNRGKVKGDLLELYGTPLEELPIKMAPIDTVTEVERLVDKIIDSAGADELSIAELNRLIYKLYNLSEAEIALVEEINGRNKV